MIDVHHIEQISQDCSLTEFVGTTVLDTIGLVIPGIDPSLLEKMNLKRPYKSLGLISSRTGAAGQINAADEAVKSTNTEIVSIELPRDTKGWGGHGCFIVIGGDNVSDVRRAVDITLEYIGKYLHQPGRTSGIHFLCLCRQSTSYGIQRSDWKTIWILLRIPCCHWTSHG